MQSFDQAKRDLVAKTLRDFGYGPMLTTKEVAEFLGITTGAVQKALVARQLIGVRIGGTTTGRWRIPVDALIDFVTSRSRSKCISRGHWSST